MSAKVTKVACQSCGANLNIDESIRFVTCGYCSARLEIVHDPSAIYTKQLEDIVKRQEAVEHELLILRLEKQIQQLEREWESFRSRVSSKGKGGALIEPNMVGPVLFGIFTGSISMMVLGVAVTESSFLLGLCAGGGLILTYFIPKHGFRRAKEFARMRTRFVLRRSQLKGQLASAERSLRFAPMARSGKPQTP